MSETNREYILQDSSGKSINKLQKQHKWQPIKKVISNNHFRCKLVKNWAENPDRKVAKKECKQFQGEMKPQSHYETGVISNDFVLRYRSEKLVLNSLPTWSVLEVGDYSVDHVLFKLKCSPPTPLFYVWIKWMDEGFNPSNAEATFVQSTRTQISLKTI